jgi:hypothetical protein
MASTPDLDEEPQLTAPIGPDIDESNVQKVCEDVVR